MQSIGSWCATVTDIAACAETVFRADPDRFAAVMAAPAGLRDTLFPLHAMAIEVARAPWVTQESMIAEMRLQWWRDALAEIAQGKTARRHEVVTPLADILTPDMAAALDGFVEVRRWDIYQEPFEDEAHFKDYLMQSSGVFFETLAKAVGGSKNGAMEYGYAVGLANFLKAVPELQARGRIPMVDGRPEAVSALAAEALVQLRGGKGLSKPVKAAFLFGWQADHILQTAAQNPDAVLDGTLGRSDAAKKASLLLAALKARF